MKKSSLVIVMVAVVAIAVAAVVFLMMTGGGSTEEKISYSADIRISDGTQYLEFKGEGQTYQEILMDAFGDDIKISNNGNVQSYKGKTNQGDNSWVVYRWKAPGTWANVSNKDLCDGMTLALEYAQRKTTTSGIEYTKPDLQIEQEIYIFMQIPDIDGIRASSQKEIKENLVKLDYWLEKSGMTDDDMRAGFWIKGKGINACEALANATHDYLYPDSEMDLEIVSDRLWVYKLDGQEGYFEAGENNGSFGWFNIFLGWTNTLLDDGAWTYWAQYTYDPDGSLDHKNEWSYNQRLFAQYDMDKYRYHAVILWSTYADDGDSSYRGAPDPSEIPKGL